MKKKLFVTVNDWVSWGGSEKLWVDLAHYLFTEHNCSIGVSIKKWDTVHPNLAELFKRSNVYERSTISSRASRY